jgi:hypothetical protein
VFRANGPADEGELRALLLAYSLDTRVSRVRRPAARYQRHLLDDLFGADADRGPGLRFEWTSEIAPAGFAGFAHDFDFARHVAQLRGWWEPSYENGVGVRVLAGGSSGTLPAQRLFALGGIGSVHGYRFKEQSGDGMVLVNGEFRRRFWRRLSGLAFADVGRVYGARPVTPGDPAAEPGDWMSGVGVGLEFEGGARLEFGWRTNDIPSSLQVLFRLRPPF